MHVNDLGAVIARARLQCEREARAQLLPPVAGAARGRRRVTSNWYWLCDLLAAEGITTVLAHAKYLKAISYAKVKTEAVDAHTLAQLLRMGYVPTAHQLPVAYRPLRDLLRQRMVMEHKRITLLQQTNSILAKFNITELQATASEASLPSLSDTVSCPRNTRSPCFCITTSASWSASMRRSWSITSKASCGRHKRCASW